MTSLEIQALVYEFDDHVASLEFCVDEVDSAAQRVIGSLTAMELTHIHRLLAPNADLPAHLDFTLRK